DKKSLSVVPPASAYYEAGRHFSVRACFGWTGGNRDGSCFCVPPQAAVGFYGTIGM
ncbi:unnamed protein product, partial [Ascophyllum nodosum]